MIMYDNTMHRLLILIYSKKVENLRQPEIVYISAALATSKHTVAKVTDTAVVTGPVLHKSESQAQRML